jgi:hypothetical protein
VVPSDAVAANLWPVIAHGQLIVYEFAPGFSFGGELAGALQRAESGGALRIREAMLVQREADTDELVVVDLRGGSGGLVAPLLDLRLDPEARRRASERALSEGAAGASGEALRELGATLAPGAAIAAVLIEHVWSATLEDAVTRTGGRPLATRFVDPDAVGGLGPLLVAVADRLHSSTQSP